MEKPIITSLRNPLIKQARALRQKKARMESRSFLVEGIHHIGEAVTAGWDVESVFYSPDLLTSEYARDLITRLSIQPQPVSAQVLESMTDKEHPQGILAVIRQRVIELDSFSLPPPEQARAKFVALVSPQDPGNLGTILRTMDAVGADALFLLDGGVELFHPTVIRSSMGTIFWKPVIQASFEQFVGWARRENYQMIGASARGDVEYQTFVADLPWILVLGSEQKGLTPDQIQACDVTVSLPMKGRVSSLNLAVAAGILLYRFVGSE